MDGKTACYNRAALGWQRKKKPERFKAMMLRLGRHHDVERLKHLSGEKNFSKLPDIVQRELQPYL